MLAIIYGINDGTGLNQYTENISNTGYTNIEEALGIVTNQLTAFTLTIANLKAIVMVADQNMTVKTNSSGSPQETISLKAGIPFIWTSEAGYFAAPFAGNVTALYLTTTQATNFKLFCEYAA